MLTLVSNQMSNYSKTGMWLRNVYDMILQVVNSMPNNIIEKIYTHSLQGFSGYIKQSFLPLY